MHNWKYPGGVNGTANSNYYLYIGSSFWTMSSYYYNITYVYGSWMYSVRDTGYLSGSGVTQSYGVRPVINLKADVLISDGDGTMDSPFTLELAS